MGRLIALFLLLPAAFAFERMAYYGMRSVLPLHLVHSLGRTAGDIGTLMSVTAAATTVALFVGGVACTVLRPSIVLAAGALVGVLGYGVLSLVGSVPAVWFAVLILALGQGLLKPAVFAFAATELPWPREHLRGGLLVLLYAATNAGALSGSSGSAFVAAQTKEAVSFALASGLAIVALLLAVAASVVDFVMPRPEPEPGPKIEGLLAGAGVLVVAALPYYAAMSVAGSVQFHVLDAAGARTASYGSIFALNPVAVVLTSGLLFVLLLVLHLTRARASSLFGIGAGLAIFALGATPLLLARGASASVILLVGSSTVAMAVGEALVGPLLLSRVLGDLPRRFAGLGAALILALSFGASWLANAVAEAWRSGGPLLLSLTAVACLVFGVALLGLAPMMARKLYSPAENPGDPRTASDAS